MITVEQLRISNDGNTLYLDAHVNKAHYFDNTFVDKVTILTEDQVSELDPSSFGDDYIYQSTSGKSNPITQLYKQPCVLSGEHLLNHGTEDGGWKINFDTSTNATTHALSFVFSGMFSTFENNTPFLLVTNTDYVPSQGFNSNNIIYKVTGSLYDGEYDSDHPIYMFKGFGNIGNSNILKFYLCVQKEDGTHQFTELIGTDNVNYLHFYYMPYSDGNVGEEKEIHLVLGINDFNEKFKANNLTENMFFVYITTKGTPSEDTPCRLDERTTLAVTFDYGIIFNRAMQYTREIANSCNIPMGFIDFILHYEALKLAIETEHYIPAIEHFKWLRNYSTDTSITTKDCGCHG